MAMRWYVVHAYSNVEHRVADAQGLERRALNQAARELLLAQASDWAFIMTMDTSPSYARKRTCDHLGRFRQLADFVDGQGIDKERLEALEHQDPIFQEIDFRCFA